MKLSGNWRKFASDGAGSGMTALRLGRATHADVDGGPLVDDPSRRKVHELVTDAVQRGARVEPAGARIRHEEVFGPVAPITTLSNEAEAFRLANDTEYGLVPYVYTSTCP